MKLLGAAKLDICKQRANYADFQVTDFEELSFDKAAMLQKTESVYGFQNSRIPFLGRKCERDFKCDSGNPIRAQSVSELGNRRDLRSYPFVQKVSTITTDHPNIRERWIDAIPILGICVFLVSLPAVFGVGLFLLDDTSQIAGIVFSIGHALLAGQMINSKGPGPRWSDFAIPL